MTEERLDPGVWAGMVIVAVVVVSERIGDNAQVSTANQNDATKHIQKGTFKQT